MRLDCPFWPIVLGLYLNLACKTAVSLVTVLKLQKNANGAAFASGASEKNFGPGGAEKLKVSGIMML